jgi:hypothetical protein
MSSQIIRQRAVNGIPSADGGDYSIKSVSGASFGQGVVVANSGAAAKRRFYKLCKNSSNVAVSGRESRSAGLRLGAATSVACGCATYNYAFETDGMRPVALRAPAAAAQLDR